MMVQYDWNHKQQHHQNISLSPLSQNIQHDNIDQFHILFYIHARLPSTLERPGIHPAGVIYLVQCVFWHYRWQRQAKVSRGL